MVLKVPGLASGMDIEAIVKDLMKAERIPLDKLNQQKQIALWQQEDYRDINSVLRELRDKTFNLKLQGAFLAKNASAANTGVAAVSASVNAANGSYSLEINQLASGVRVMSSVELADETDTATGTTKTIAGQFGLAAGQTITFTMQGAKKADGSYTSADIQLSTDDTIYSLVSKINSAKDADGTSLGLTAQWDAAFNRISIVSKGTGSSQYFAITNDSSGFWANQLKIDTSKQYTGVNAKFKIAGAADFIESQGNSVSILGLNIDFKDAGTTAITVGNNTDAIFNTIKDWVDKYNEVLEKVNGKLTEKRYRDYPPLSDEQKKGMSDKDIELWEEKARSGLLANDPLLGDAVTKMRSVLGSAPKGISSDYHTLSEIGITTGSNYLEKGKLYLDESKLKEALQKDPRGIMNLFTNSGTGGSSEGFAVQIYSKVSESISRLADKAGSTGDFSLVDNSILGKQLKQYDERISTLTDRLDQVEQRYWRQFTAMEQAINQMNAQSAWLAQQLGQGQ